MGKHDHDDQHDQPGEHCGEYPPPPKPPCEEYPPQPPHGSCCPGPNPDIAPAHGRIDDPVSRAQFALNNNWLGTSIANEMEGGKNFPMDTYSPLIWYAIEARDSSAQGYPLFYSDETVTSLGPLDPPSGATIVSGGHTDSRNIVNYTDAELEAAKGTKWPRKIVSPGENLRVHWVYGMPHKSRAYRCFITHNDWEAAGRLTRDSFEQGSGYLGPTGSPANVRSGIAAPFYSAIHRYTDFWDSRLVPLDYVDIPLPSNKMGHHVLLVVWTIPDGGNAFYQAIDLEFRNQAVGWSEPEYPQWSPFCTYKPGMIVRWKCANWQARYVTQGTEPGTRAPDGSYVWLPL